MKRLLAIAATAICCMGNQAPAKAHNYQVVLEKYAATRYSLICADYDKRMSRDASIKLSLMYANEMGVKDEDITGNPFVNAEINRLVDKYICAVGPDNQYITN